MPQMAPLLWLVLFVYFISLFILMMTIMYYFGGTALPHQSQSSSCPQNSFSWDW